MDQSPWEANSCPADQEITRLLWNPEFSVPCSQESATDPYPAPDESSTHTREGVSKSFRTGRLKRELQMVQLSAARCSIAVLWVNVVSFAAITICVGSQRVFIVAVYFVIDSVRKILDILSCFHIIVMKTNHLKMGSEQVAETSCILSIPQTTNDAQHTSYTS
jgi:hypothetical protein